MDYSQCESRLTDLMSTIRHSFVTKLLQSREEAWLKEAKKLQMLSDADFVDYACTFTDPRLESFITELRRIDAALCQLDLGLYGICSDCEEPIEEERLEEDPCIQRCQCCEDKRNAQTRQDLFAL